MTSTAQSKEVAADDVISELTDKAIDAEIRKLDRMIKSRDEEMAEIQADQQGFRNRRALLTEQKIARLRAQLPQEQT